MRDNLAFVHQVIAATEQLLKEAADLATGDLKAYYLKHLEEERDHAKWLAEDLDGYSIGLSHLAVAMAGSQYYLIKHVHPAALLGYMLALENPVPMKRIEELEAAYGKKLIRTYRHHAEVDAGHRAELIEQVEKLSPELQALVRGNEKQTLGYLAMYPETRNCDAAKQ